MSKESRSEERIRRHRRVRKHINGTSERPRMCVFRSLSEIYVQVINDEEGLTLVSASSIDKDLREQAKSLSKTQQADLVGKIVAERALGKGIKQVVFDRGGYQYFGRVKTLAEAARKQGLEF